MSPARTLGLAVLLSALALGCTTTQDWVWRERPIPADLLPGLASWIPQASIAVVNDQPDAEPRTLGVHGRFELLGSARELTQAIVDQLSGELQRRSAIVHFGASRYLALAVLRNRVIVGARTRRAILEVRLVTGGGYENTYVVDHRTPYDMAYAYNEAISLAVIQVLEDPQVIAYLGEPS
jgi:hypothetical protein